MSSALSSVCNSAWCGRCRSSRGDILKHCKKKKYNIHWIKMSIPYLDLPFYKIFLQTPIHFCPLVSFSSTHIFLANNPESSIIINFIYYKFTTILNNLKTQGTLNLNWTHWSLLLHSSLQSSQLETLQIISRNFILLTLSLTHSAIHNRKRSTWYNENIQHTHRFELLTGLEVEMLELNHEGK